MSAPVPDLTNIVARFEVNLMRGGKVFRRSFKDLQEAIDWRDEIVRTHLKGHAGRPSKPGRRWAQGQSMYHILRDHGLCACKAPITDGFTKCPRCRSLQAANRKPAASEPA